MKKSSACLKNFEKHFEKRDIEVQGEGKGDR